VVGNIKIGWLVHITEYFTCDVVQFQFLDGSQQLFKADVVSASFSPFLQHLARFFTHLFTVVLVPRRRHWCLAACMLWATDLIQIFRTDAETSTNLSPRPCRCDVFRERLNCLPHACFCYQAISYEKIKHYDRFICSNKLRKTRKYIDPVYLDYAALRLAFDLLVWKLAYRLLRSILGKFTPILRLVF